VIDVCFLIEFMMMIETLQLILEHTVPVGVKLIFKDLK